MRTNTLTNIMMMMSDGRRRRLVVVDVKFGEWRVMDAFKCRFAGAILVVWRGLVWLRFVVVVLVVVGRPLCGLVGLVVVVVVFGVARLGGAATAFDDFEFFVLRNFGFQFVTIGGRERIKFVDQRRRRRGLMRRWMSAESYNNDES